MAEIHHSSSTTTNQDEFHQQELDYNKNTTITVGEEKDLKIYYDSKDSRNTTPILHAFGGTSGIFGKEINKYEYVTNHLPFKVKKIKCSGEYELEYTIYWTIQNEIYLSSSNLESEHSDDNIEEYKQRLLIPITFIDTNTNESVWKLFKINLNYLLNSNHYHDNQLNNNQINNISINRNENLIKNIKCSGNCILFELFNQKVIIIDGRTFNLNNQIKIYSYTFPNLKKIKRGCVSNHLLFLMNNNEMKWINTMNDKYELENIPIFKYGIIKYLAISNKSIIIINNENKLYGYGSNEYNQFSDKSIINENDFTYIETIFEKESKVKSLKCGYSHTVVLLENGNIYSVGLNSLEQAGQPNPTDDGSASINNFMKFTLAIDLLDKIEAIYCISRGTILQTSKEFICIGEIVKDCNLKCDFGGIHAVRLERRIVGNVMLNHCTNGPWHYLFYFKNKNISKDLIYYLKNLKLVANQQQLSNNDAFSDVDIL